MENIRFSYSALLGMLTHVIWDSFTHQNGLMVTKLRVLTQTYTIFGYQIPIYKFLQHGSTMFGIMLIFGYIYYRASLSKDKNTSSIATKEDHFWSLLAVLTLGYVCLWQLINGIPLRSYGIWVVRIIDSCFGSILTLSFFLAYKKRTLKEKRLPKMGVFLRDWEYKCKGSAFIGLTMK